MSRSGPSPHILMTIILHLTLITLICCQSQSQTLRPYTTTYIVKFFKATSSQLQNIQDRNITLTQIQFLQKLVRNTSNVLKQAVFYVNFTVQAPVTSDFSNLAVNKNSPINDKNINQVSPPSLPAILPNLSPTLNNTNPASGINNVNNNNTKGNRPITNENSAGRTGRNQTTDINGTINLVNSTDAMSIKSNTDTNLSKLQAINTSPMTVPTNTANTILNPFQNLPTSTLTLTKPTPSPPSPPLPAKKILNTEFPGIGLYHNIPTKFIKNEIYKFSGILTDPTMVFIADSAFTDVNFVNIIFTQIQGNQEVKCIDRVNRKKLEFQISCRLRISGAFYISIFSGNSGYSSNTIRNVFSPAIRSSITKSTQIPPTPKNLNLQLIQSQLYITWSSISPLTKITFTQQSLTLQFILSNYHQRFLVPYHQFKNFDQIKTNITISHANTNTNNKQDGLYGISSMFGDMLRVTINPVQHMHSNNNQNAFQLKNQLKIKIPVNQSIDFSAIFSVPAQNEIFIVSPYSEVTKIYFNTKLKNANTKTGNGNTPGGLIPPKTLSKFNYKFEQQGAYLLQINQDSGLAIINQPIYVGDVYPLLPDYIDIKIQSILDKSDIVSELQKYVSSLYPKQAKISQPPKISSLESKRNYMLTLLNLLRTKQIINPVYVDKKLTEIAQNHSNDMALNNYFSHNNLKGEGPGQRAKNFGFYFAIGENVAQSTSLTEGHLSLQRSAAHFENSINKIWTRVGIGINQTVFGQYLITFQFSSRDILLEPLTKTQLETHQKQLIKMLTRKYPNLKQQSPQISNLILQWMLTNRSIPLPQYILSKNPKEQILHNSIKFTYYPNFVEQIEKSDGLFGDVSKYSRVGVNLGLNKVDNTVVECYFVFLVGQGQGQGA